MNHDRTEERITSIIKLWKEVYGEELSRVDAQQKIAQLLHLYRTLMQPLPGDEHQDHPHNTQLTLW